MLEPVTAPVPRKLKMAVLNDSDAESSILSPALSPVTSPVLPGLLLPSKTDSSLPSLLEELLDDCFHYSISPKVLCDLRAQYVQSFHKFLRERHTHENLAFVIDIFSYEYYFDKIFPENVELQKSRSDCHSQYSHSFLNLSIEHFIDSLPYPTSSMQRKIQKSRNSSSQTLLSDHFGFEFDDLPLKPAEAWDALKDVTVSSDEESLASSRKTSGSIDTDALLSDQWDYIILEFIVDNAPQQVNLSNKTARDILAENDIKQRHNPIVLIKAKLEVTQLLKENAYSTFRTLRAQADACDCRGLCKFTAALPLKSRKARSGLKLPSTPIDVDELREINFTSAFNSKSGMATPLPHSKLKSKFLSHLSSNSDTSSSGSSLSSFIHHFKTSGSNVARPVASVPHSTMNSQTQSPVLEIERPSSTVNDASSLLNKLWRKKK